MLKLRVPELARIQKSESASLENARETALRRGRVGVTKIATPRLRDLRYQLRLITKKPPRRSPECKAAHTKWRIQHVCKYELTSLR
jgi:hypothetical protein